MRRPLENAEEPEARRRRRPSAAGRLIRASPYPDETLEGAMRWAINTGRVDLVLGCIEEGVTPWIMVETGNPTDYCNDEGMLRVMIGCGIPLTGCYPCLFGRHGLGMPIQHQAALELRFQCGVSPYHCWWSDRCECAKNRGRVRSLQRQCSNVARKNRLDLSVLPDALADAVRMCYV